MLSAKLTHLVLFNEVFVPPDERATTALRDDDVLALWPPVADGLFSLEQSSGAADEQHAGGVSACVKAGFWRRSERGVGRSAFG